MSNGVGSAQVLAGALLRIPVKLIEPGPNARGELGDVRELALSLMTLGQQKPLLVTELGGGRYQVLDGHRRLAAAKDVGLPHLDAVVRRDHGPAVRLQQQLAIHAQGKAFDPIAEAKALHTLMFEHNLSREEIAQRVGKSPVWVRDRIGLLHLRPDEQRDVAAGRMTLATANATLAQRRAERDGRWSPPRPAPRRALASPPVEPAPVRHCATCRCGELAEVVS